MRPAVPLVGELIRLRRWAEHDREPFAAMNADPVVMADLGGPLERSASDEKLDRFDAAFDTHGAGRWAMESLDEDRFLGYVGVMPRGDDHVLGPHHDLGWRLTREAWGFGHATAGARLAIADAFERVGLSELLAYTAPDNERSQAVMTRLQLRRDPSRDFVQTYPDTGAWHGLVWSADRTNHAAPH